MWQCGALSQLSRKLLVKLWGPTSGIWDWVIQGTQKWCHVAMMSLLILARKRRQQLLNVPAMPPSSSEGSELPEEKEGSSRHIANWKNTAPGASTSEAWISSEARSSFAVCSPGSAGTLQSHHRMFLSDQEEATLPSSEWQILCTPLSRRREPEEVHKEGAAWSQVRWLLQETKRQQMPSWQAHPGQPPFDALGWNLGCSVPPASYTTGETSANSIIVELCH